MHVGMKIHFLASMGRAKVLYGPANGVFPQYCKWREKIQAKKDNIVWANMQYEFLELHHCKMEHRNAPGVFAARGRSHSWVSSVMFYTLRQLLCECFLLSIIITILPKAMQHQVRRDVGCMPYFNILKKGTQLRLIHVDNKPSRMTARQYSVKYTLLESMPAVLFQQSVTKERKSLVHMTVRNFRWSSVHRILLYVVSVFQNLPPIFAGQCGMETVLGPKCHVTRWAVSIRTSGESNL